MDKNKIQEYLNTIATSNFKAEFFLEYLLTNANKAVCKKEKENSLDGAEFEGHIEVYFEPSDKSITIVDNGIGMNKEELNDYVHKYAEEKMEQNKIGLLSLFSIADKVSIISKKLPEQFAHKLNLELDNISLVPCVNDEDSGTVIYIKLREEFANDFTNKEKLMNYLKKLKHLINYNFIMSYYDSNFEERIEKISYT